MIDDGFIMSEECLGVTVWLTGLSGSGKTTISRGLRSRLMAMTPRVELLDGDVIRKNLCRGLGFSKEDRDENIRRIGFVANLLTRHGVIVVVSAISPYRSVREEMRLLISNFVLVYVNAPLSICEGRDPKGLYKKARAGEIENFTGVSDPYEPPLDPDVICFTDRESESDCVDKVLLKLKELRYF